MADGSRPQRDVEAGNPGWALWIPPALNSSIAKLAGKRAGLQEKLRQLRQDPCQPSIGGYRLSGPLAPIVCGAHLNRGYRIAFTLQPAYLDDELPRVVVLYVGKREPGHRGATDVWDVLHDLFDVDNPPAGHLKPPCCEEDLPSIDADQLDAFVRSLRAFHRQRSR